MNKLEYIIQLAVNRTIAESVSRHTSNLTEELMNDLLQNPETKEHYIRLINQAIVSALENLNKE